VNVFVIHGPNLNMLGKREVSVYGDVDLETINTTIMARSEELGLVTRIEQSNHEGAIVDLIHRESKWVDVLIINPGAYTHTSIAIRDALLSIDKPVIEVHLSNIFKRESFRSNSYVSDIAVGLVSGFGLHSYTMALDAAVSIIKG